MAAAFHLLKLSTGVKAGWLISSKAGSTHTHSWVPRIPRIPRIPRRLGLLCVPDKMLWMEFRQLCVLGTLIKVSKLSCASYQAEWLGVGRWRGVNGTRNLPRTQPSAASACRRDVRPCNGKAWSVQHGITTACSLLGNIFATFATFACWLCQGPCRWVDKRDSERASKRCWKKNN